MRLSTILLIFVAILIAGYIAGRRKALLLSHGDKAAGVMHSLPVYHGYYVLLWGALPTLALILAYFALGDSFVISRVVAALPDALRNLPDAKLNLIINDIRILASGAPTSNAPDPAISTAAGVLSDTRDSLSVILGLTVFAMAVLGCYFAWRSLTRDFRARNRVESTIQVMLIGAASIAVLTTIGIVFSVLFESLRFFQKVPFFDFLFGLNWSPQTAIRADQVGSSGSFGAVPLFVGTLMISGIAMFIALPIGLMVAIYLSEYTTQRIRSV
ncbi:MAG: phosphate ABC transporter permease family protein, partial [Gammaproteobacteria bacterium]|nr:phosphate ABC transporter permease family protein [Gammaproteobacteria bacterium]